MIISYLKPQNTEQTNDFFLLNWKDVIIIIREYLKLYNCKFLYCI